MKLLRMILVGLLSLSIPATALATMVSQSQCEQFHARADTLMIDPGHSAHTADQKHDNHAQHMTASDNSPPTDLERCNHCSTGHCASGCATTLANNSFFFANTVHFDTELLTLPGSHTAGAHSLELLRPPSLT